MKGAIYSMSAHSFIQCMKHSHPVCFLFIFIQHVLFSAILGPTLWLSDSVHASFMTTSNTIIPPSRFPDETCSSSLQQLLARPFLFFQIEGEQRSTFWCTKLAGFTVASSVRNKVQAICLRWQASWFVFTCHCPTLAIHCNLSLPPRKSSLVNR